MEVFPALLFLVFLTKKKISGFLSKEKYRQRPLRVFN